MGVGVLLAKKKKRAGDNKARLESVLRVGRKKEQITETIVDLVKVLVVGAGGGRMVS